jgi:glucosamine kinase
MILIADSGSTKTDWRFIDDKGSIAQFATGGFNPYFQTTEQIALEIKTKLLPELSEKIKGISVDIYFYGAGCSAPNKIKTVEDALTENFSTGILEVRHDLLAAARALCGHSEGIAAILGTGSNSCYYDGQNIVRNVDSLGFILGDEGSGAHLGKTLLAAYLNKELPVELSNRFTERFQLSKEEILENIYKKPLPNRYLASFAKFIFQNLKEQYLVDMVAGCFREFFDKHICKYEQHRDVKMGCVGSVGFYFSNILRAIAAEKGVAIGTILESPIAGLVLYHTHDQA